MVEQLSDFKMPEKVVTRLLRDALPDNVVVSKDAKNAACRSASIFILQMTIAAAERAQSAKRKTLDNQDIIKAVTELGLGEYAPQLVRFGAQRKRNAKRKESSLMKTKTTKKLFGEDGDMQHDVQDLTPEAHETTEQTDQDAQKPDSQEISNHESGGDEDIDDADEHQNLKKEEDE